MDNKCIWRVKWDGILYMELVVGKTSILGDIPRISVSGEYYYEPRVAPEYHDYLGSSVMTSLTDTTRQT